MSSPFCRGGTAKVFFTLFLELLLQNAHNKRCDGYCSHSVIFGSCYVMRAAFFFSLLELLFYGDYAVTKVYCIP